MNRIEVRIRHQTVTVETQVVPWRLPCAENVVQYEWLIQGLFTCTFAVGASGLFAVTVYIVVAVFSHVWHMAAWYSSKVCWCLEPKTGFLESYSILCIYDVFGVFLCSAMLLRARIEQSTRSYFAIHP